MNQNDIMTFQLPAYAEIPNVGLYLKQVVTFINDVTEPLLHTSVTSTMLSNYVKLHLVSNPVKKMYDRDQIVCLLWIVLVKNVLSLDNIRQLLLMQKEEAEVAEVYDEFKEELEGTLRQVFSRQAYSLPEKEEKSVFSQLFSDVIMTLVQKIYLDECFRLLQMESSTSS